MKHNTTLLVRNEQKPKQRKDRKYNNNMKKAGRVQGSTQRMMTCPVKKSTIRLKFKSGYKSSPIEAILQGIYIKSYPGGQLKK